MEKKKKMSIIVGLITLVLIITLGTTALWKWNSSNNNVGFSISGLDAYIIYNKGTDVLTGVLDPVANYTDTSVSTEITLYKNTSKTLYGHIYLDITTIGSNLANEKALKWVITSNDKILNQGDFVGSKVGDSLSLKLNIPLSQTEQTFKIYIWLDESMDINDEIEGEILSTIVRAEASEVEYEIEPNAPKLTDGLIPVTYSNDKWVKADRTNTNNDWYNYGEKKWANAVLVSDTNRSTYQSATAGTEIPESDVLAYYVWIPRYKYRVWNINKEVGVDSYDAYNTGIDILFETGTESSGTITCNDYSFAAPTADIPNETCSGANDDYYTHPAFTFGDTEVEGIWVGKFEISSSNPTSTDGGGNSTSLTVRVKPNVNSWRYNTLSNFSYVIQNMQVTDNEYGLTTDKTVADSHMMKNMEWGAVAYLTNSNYGRCSDGTCTEVAINSYNSYKTGCGPQSAGSTSSGSTCNAYTTALGQTASTTGNVYGIYDMSGGAFEYVMGNESYGSGSYTYDASSAGNNFSYSTETAKYLDTYAYGTSYSDQAAYNRARLGDATGENVLSTGDSGGWYGDSAYFVDSFYPWFHRGGHYNNGSDAGLFYFSSYSGDVTSSLSAGAALLVL